MNYNKKFYLNKEFYLGLSAVCFGAFLFTVRDRNAGIYLIYPHLIFSAMIVLGCIMMAGTMLRPTKVDIRGIRVSMFELMILLLLLITRPLINLLGIYSGIFLVSLVLSAMVQKEHTVKQIMGLVVFNLVMIAVLYLVFTIFLKVNTPKGLLF